MTRETILNRFMAEARAKKGYSWSTYQPIPLPGYEETRLLAGRVCADRANAIYEDIAKSFNRPVSVIDWGCNMGYFVFEAAKRGHAAVGVDKDSRFIKMARFLSNTACPYYRVPFVHSSLQPDSITQLGPFDVALCLSVLHHLKWSEQVAIIQLMADMYSVCYIEMDGHNCGRDTLEVFFYYVEEVCTVSDKYGAGTRTRKTFRCANQRDDVRYSNLKRVNFMPGRGVFLKQTERARTVIKRETHSCSHTWLKTSLTHERAMYATCRLHQFVKLIDSGENDRHRWLELEYAECHGNHRSEDIRAFFSELERKRLFMFDIVRDSFIPTKRGLRVVDIESLFAIANTIADTARDVSKHPERQLPFTTYPAAIAAVIGACVNNKR